MHLLAWVRSLIPEQDVQNFTTHWADGVALEKLAAAVGCTVPDAQLSAAGSPLERCRLVISAAEAPPFNIPRLIEAEDIVTDSPDEYSVSYVVVVRCVCVCGRHSHLGCCCCNSTLRQVMIYINGYRKYVQSFAAQRQRELEELARAVLLLNGDGQSGSFLALLPRDCFRSALLPFLCGSEPAAAAALVGVEKK